MRSAVWDAEPELGSSRGYRSRRNRSPGNMHGRGLREIRDDEKRAVAPPAGMGGAVASDGAGRAVSADAERVAAVGRNDRRIARGGGDAAGKPSGILGTDNLSLGFREREFDLVCRSLNLHRMPATRGA